MQPSSAFPQRFSAVPRRYFDFVSGLWRIHPFREGNTRTTAVFTIIYLRRLGFTVVNKPFASNARLFRDALALDNTSDPDFKDPAPLNRFIEKTLFDSSITLERLRDSAPPNQTRTALPCFDPNQSEDNGRCQI
ncbi:Fic family protein [Bifidobacterium dentium]|uniref:Fic family protein n=1 Tax=Bifidobacterium dentium TaxID=1689 RepID=UPI0018C29EAA|nr:Fic family protein [Bifidobacterium dentium]MBF9696325.1 Fic family protein [Bifidobacterium dentium]MBF9712484.1 Fic family protein [Bifidobacterium dentium]MBF9714446.1 Fic family protein [Bifidobacterium dentium]MBF9718418.1 Fic family protein [Bifidobacterium dentium]